MLSSYKSSRSLSHLLMSSCFNMQPRYNRQTGSLIKLFFFLDRFFWASPFYVFSFFSILFCLVPCGRLSWLLVSFWAHVNIVHHTYPTTHFWYSIKCIFWYNSIYRVEKNPVVRQKSCKSAALLLFFSGRSHIIFPIFLKSYFIDCSMYPKHHPNPYIRNHEGCYNHP